jgi:hypothetical protein
VLFISACSQRQPPDLRQDPNPNTEIAILLSAVSHHALEEEHGAKLNVYIVTIHNVGPQWPCIMHEISSGSETRKQNDS